MSPLGERDAVSHRNATRQNCFGLGRIPSRSFRAVSVSSHLEQRLRDVRLKFEGDFGLFLQTVSCRLLMNSPLLQKVFTSRHAIGLLFLFNSPQYGGYQQALAPSQVDQVSAKELKDGFGQASDLKICFSWFSLSIIYRRFCLLYKGPGTHPGSRACAFLSRRAWRRSFQKITFD